MYYSAVFPFQGDLDRSGRRRRRRRREGEEGGSGLMPARKERKERRSGHSRNLSGCWCHLPSLSSLCRQQHTHMTIKRHGAHVAFLPPYFMTDETGNLVFLVVWTV